WTRHTERLFRKRAWRSRSASARQQRTARMGWPASRRSRAARSAWLRSSIEELQVRGESALCRYASCQHVDAEPVQDHARLFAQSVRRLPASGAAPGDRARERAARLLETNGGFARCILSVTHIEHPQAAAGEQRFALPHQAADRGASARRFGLLDPSARDLHPAGGLPGPARRSRSRQGGARQRQEYEQGVLEDFLGAAGDSRFGDYAGAT